MVGGVVASFAAFGFPMPAHACGGGVVTSTEGTVANAQRIVVSVHDGVTDVITQIGVPDTTADYGALLPVPSEPTLDSEPVSAEELEALDAETKPIIMTYSSSGGGEDAGCSCGDDAESKSSGGGGAPLRGDVSRPVEIGPVTAVVLTADDGDAVRTWLGDNEFVIPAEHAALIDAYAGPGRYFIAIKRNANATMGGATSIGVHFTLAEEHGELPLRFARLGAAENVAFSVFVAADIIVAPAAPFTTRSLYDLESALLHESYATAVAEASNRDGELAFVIEGAYRVEELSGRVGPSLEAMIGAGNQRRLTRLTTVLPAEALTEDAHFTETYDFEPPRNRSLGLIVNPSAASAAALWLALFLRRLRTRRVARPSRHD